MLNDALYWGTELFMSNYAKYIMNRLIVISSEDIGLANINAPSTILNYYKMFETTESLDKKNVILAAISYAVKSKKSRLIDNIACEYYFLPETLDPINKNEYLTFENPLKVNDLFGNKLDYSDLSKYEKDVWINAFYTYMFMGDEHSALIIGMDLLRRNEIESIWKIIRMVALQKCCVSNSEIVSAVKSLQELFTILKANGNKRNEENLQFVHAILLISRCQENDTKFHDNLYNRERKRLDIPDWALDMHTRRGKMKGRGNDYFYTDSAKIENWDENVSDEWDVRDRVWNKYKVKG